MSVTKKFNLMHFESKSFKKRMLFPNEKVGPDLAKDLLTLNDQNRPVKNTVVKQYTKEMTEGHWVFTGDTIGISNEGKLLNGQHRLLAIINSNTTQEFHIQTGLEPQSFNKMDIGKLRSAGDTLAMKGYTSYSTVATIVRYVTMYTAGLLGDYTNSAASKYKFTNQEIADAAEQLNKTLLQNAATTANKYYARSKFMDATTIGPLYYIFYNIDAERALNFFDMLSTGDGIGMEKYSPIFLLRNKLINSMSSGSKLSSKHKFALIIKAWNAYREDRQLKQLTWTEQNQEEFPKPK